MFSIMLSTAIELPEDNNDRSLGTNAPSSLYML